jgi:hypothetical protein
MTHDGTAHLGSQEEFEVIEFPRIEARGRAARPRAKLSP